MSQANGPSGKIPVTAVALAALTAVAFWSLKPIFISIIADRGDYAEVYVTSGAIALVASAIVAIILRRWTTTLLRGGRPALRAALDASMSGLFLGLWYYGFYRALYGTSKADATIIAFTWPLIAVIAVRVLSPTTAPRLRWHQWLLVLASFAGAAAIGVANLGGEAQTGGQNHDIIYAFVAAIGSGLYLPFAINSSNRFHTLIGSRPGSTFYAIAIANTVSLLAILVSLRVTDHQLRFYAFARPSSSSAASSGSAPTSSPRSRGPGPSRSTSPSRCPPCRTSHRRCPSSSSTCSSTSR